ncbi:MAG: flagellar hook-basal body complex protein [Candidatus Omnitrophica bacterium]|nr:flagellar hook-basal body complex protein [Candidatus Omnitrophota bacterium]
MTIRSLYVGLSGLNASSRDIDVIGNNIANINTVGYQASTTSFDDIFYQTLSAGVRGSNPIQIGNGVQLGSVNKIFTPGSTESTERLLDLAINGDGFFILEDGAGTQYLTRAGDFALNDEGYIVDSDSGFKLIGQTASADGRLSTAQTPGALQIDYTQQSAAQATTQVSASGNFDVSVGEKTSVAHAESTSSLLGLFDANGTPLGLANGDVIQFESGFLQLNDAPSGVDNPIDLSAINGNNKGEGVILTVTSTTTVADMQNALTSFFSNTFSEATPGVDSGLTVSFNSEGSFVFSNTSENALQGVRIGLDARQGQSSPPAESNQLVGNLFVNEGDPDFSKTLNVGAGEVVATHTARQADRTTSIEVYDSLGTSHTISVGMTADTTTPAAEAEAKISSLKDGEGRFLIPEGVVPAKVELSEVKNDPAANTATFTATQISNIVATQGVYSYTDANGNLIALRLTDGAVSINGGAFNNPADETIRSVFTDNGLDVTGSEFLNASSAANLGGLLGDAGINENTTLETIRESLESRINSALRQVSNSLAEMDTTALPVEFDAPDIAAALTTPTTQPQIKVSISKDGSFVFEAIGGSLGASALPEDDERTQNLIQAAGGKDNMGLMLDLAAKTRSIQVSTLDSSTDPATDDNAVDTDRGDAAQSITGFLSTATADEIFGSDLSAAFSIGDTDTGPLVEGDPTADPPTGVLDSGVQLVALSSGVYYQPSAADADYFSGYQAFDPEVSAFQALFNQQGYGAAADIDGDGVADRSDDAPVGVVVQNGMSFETNTIHDNGKTRNTVNYQVVVPNDSREVPVGTTGTIIFDSKGQFQRYGAEGQPVINFDADNGDPQNGGAEALTFDLDLSKLTYYDSSHTAQMQNQDGRPVGRLENVAIADNGEIKGLYSNGDSKSMGKILLGSVTNEGGLTQYGNTMYTFREGDNTGEFRYLEAGVDGGSINSNTLELSNVDLASEFVNLITAQRAYQASARVITTTDDMLTELMSIKR